MKTVRMLYLVFANTLVLLVLVILGTHLFFKTYYLVWNASAYQRLPEVATRNYAHMTADDIGELLKAWNTLRHRYAPWVGYRADLTKSRFVNIDEYGFRANGKTGRDISAIQDAVWFFGGSTTVGWGLADEETIPAKLEKLMGRPVVNFGVPAFCSAQENLLLNQYLRIGYRPSVAIFLDGINESCEMEDYQTEMRLLFSKAQDGYGWDPAAFAKPVTYAYDKVSRKLKTLRGDKVDLPNESDFICEDNRKRIALRTLHARILGERDSLCRLYEIECITFVQPFAGVHGQHDDMTLTDADRKLMRGKFDHLEANWRKAGAIFVTDAFDKHKRHAFIDDTHYSAAASELIARAIAPHLATPRK